MISEKQFQENVVTYARLNGWLVYHTHDSRRSEPGFPDLVLVNPARGELHFAELKTTTGKVSAPQHKWLEAISETGIPAHVWRPEDWDTIEATLGRKARARNVNPTPQVRV